MLDEPELIFVHHAGHPDDQWAEWVAWQLEEAGYQVELELWHWRAGDDVVTRMNAALERASALVAVISPHYFEPERNTEFVWGPVVGRRGRLIPVVIRPLENHLPAILSSRLAVELHGLDEDAATRALIQAVKGSSPPHSRPDYPPRIPNRRQPRYPGKSADRLTTTQDNADRCGGQIARTAPVGLLAGDRGHSVDHVPRHEAVHRPPRQDWAAEPLGRPIRDLDPYQLEVHRAIEVRGAQGLPAYLERQHDKRLQAVVAQAVAGKSQFVMLVGTSSSGKTRSCYEALRLLPDDWRLWHPYNPDRRRAVLADLEHVGPKTVVWLNEAHHYLLDFEHSEAIAAGLRSLLSDDGRAPVLVLGTIWPGPGYFDELRSKPPLLTAVQAGLPEPAVQRDPLSQARLLVVGHELHVPTSFSPEEVERLKQSSDPRLVDAAQSARDGMVTQYLAAAFELVALYNHAPPAQKALLDAAVDARRLGHPERLPLPFLLDASEAYLTDTEWDLLPDNWHQLALAQLASPVKGVQGPLYLAKRPRGSYAIDEPAPEPAYRVADYLLDHLRAVRRTQPVPALFWQAALRHCAGQAAKDLAVAAAARGLKQVACLLWAQAGEFSEVGRQLVEAYRLDDALPWFKEAYVFGDLRAVGTAMEELVLADRDDDAAAWCEALPGVTTAEAARWAAEAMAKAGHIDVALPWFARAADNGDTSACLSAAEALADSGRRTEALPWFERAAMADDSHVADVAAEWLSVINLPSGRHRLGTRPEPTESARIHNNLPLGEVSRWANHAFRQRQPVAALVRAQQLVRQGQLEQALSEAEKTAAEGEMSALYWAGQQLADVGRWTEAFTWCRRAVAAGSELAAHLAIVCLEELGRDDDAQHLEQFGWTAEGDIADPWPLHPTASAENE
ncbi:toll/interleukin-1 receptor domain-containing protein [Streptomyces pharetrae]|uniref:toll/interleukin-1 receptor domain-containing protein n=1 Tax=Streptomyces pharetrae TaxID=291370 RepID=UPI0034608545